MDKTTKEFRSGLVEGKLLIQQCNECQKLNMYPRFACPFCQSESLGWSPSQGRGILHSYTILRMGAPQGFEEDLPYALGIIELEEGVRVLGRLLPDESGGWETYRCDAVVDFVSTNETGGTGVPVAYFKQV